MPKTKQKKSRNLKQKITVNKFTVLAAAAVIAVIGAIVLRVSHASTPNTALDRLKIIGVAAGEVGNREYNARVKEYTGRSDQPEWCAYFVSWVMKTSGYPLRDGDNWRVPAVYASNNNLKDLFIQMGAWTENKPKQNIYPTVGDILIFKRSHTGFVSATNQGGTLYTIEGNSSAAGKPNSVARNNYTNTSVTGNDAIEGWGNVDAFINRSPTKK